MFRLRSVRGNKWAFISTHLPGRTDNETKNYWNNRLKNKPLAKETPRVTQTASQLLLAVADLHSPTANYLRRQDQKLHSGTQLPNLHLLQGLGYITPNPQTHLHELGFDSTDPQDLPTLPPQGTRFSCQAMEHTIPQLNNNHGVDFINMSTGPAHTRPSPPQELRVNYQAMEDPTVHNYQFGPLITKTPNTGSIPNLQVNDNHAGDVGWNVPNAGSTPALMASASSEFPKTNQVEKEITPAEEIFISLSTSTTVEACRTELLMDPPECSVTNQAENEILSASISFEAFWTECTDSPELDMTNQVEKEITPPAGEISNLFSASTTFETLPELHMANETTYPFWGDLALV